MRGYSDGGDPWNFAPDALLNMPASVAVDTAEKLYIADTGNRRVRQVDLATGIITTIAGDGTSGFGGDGGPATSAQLTPYGIAVDDAGNLFIADDLNQRIRRVDLTTGVITTYAGTGTAGYSGDGGPATDATLNLYYSSLAVDDAGNLFISDVHNHKIRRVDHSTGVITTVVNNINNWDVAANAEYLFIPDNDSGVRAVNLATGVSSIISGTGTISGITIDSAGGLFALQARQTVRVTYGLEISVTDTTQPTATINRAASQPSPTQVGPLHFTAVFSKPVVDFSSAGVTLGGTSDADKVVVYDVGDHQTFDILVSGMMHGGTVTVDIAAGVAHDATGNANLAATNTDNSVTFTVPDYTPPVASANPSGVATGASSATFTVAYTDPDDPVLYSSIDGNDIQVTGVAGFSQLATLVDTTPSTNASSITATYRIDSPDGPWTQANAGTYTITMQSSQVSDTNNNFVAPGDLGTFQIADITPPTVTINQTSGQADPTNASPINFTVVFSEPVSDFSTGDVTFSGSTTGGTLIGAVTNPSSDQKIYNVAVSGMADSGAVVATIAAGAAHDAANNSNTVATFDDNTVQYNMPGPPTFDLTDPTSGTYTVGQDVTIAWTAANVGSGSTISLCYDTDATFSGNETWIEVGQVAAADGAGSYTWDTTGMTAGTYYVGGYLWSGGTATFSHLGQSIAIAAPLTLAASSAEKIEQELSDDVVLDGRDELAPIVEEAIRRLASANNSSILAYASIEIVDLPNLLLGETVGNTIRIDRDAAGYGWFVAPTPADDLEFADVIGQHVLAAGNSSPAAHRVDLLTTVMHEMGHVLGYKHSDSFDLMHPALPLGTRWSLSGESAFSTGKRDSDIAWDNRLVNTSVLDRVFASFDDHRDRFA